MEQWTFISFFLAFTLISFPPVHGTLTPEQTKSHTDFEEREYKSSRWISTDLDGLTASSLKAGYATLNAYCQEEDVTDKFKDSWPVLVTKTGSTVVLSWLVPGNLTLQNSDKVRLENRAAGTVYEMFNSVFIPYVSGIQATAKKLQDALTTAGKSYDHQSYSVAGTLPFTTEIWIYAN